MSGTAQGLFTAGAAIFAAAGAGHGLLALADTVRPRWFAPDDDAVRRAMDGTGMRFRQPFPVAAAYFAIAVRYWFGAIMLMTGSATALFAAAALLSL